VSIPTIKPAPQPHFMSVPEAARCVGISVRTFYRLVADGTLPALTQLGGRSLVAYAKLAEACKRIERGGA
jgi:excisionase family DNA binding protein